MSLVTRKADAMEQIVWEQLVAENIELRAKVARLEGVIKADTDDKLNHPHGEREFCKGCTLPLRENAVDQQFRELEAAWRAKMVEKFSIPAPVIMPPGSVLIPMRKSGWWFSLRLDKKLFQLIKKHWRKI